MSDEGSSDVMERDDHLRIRFRPAAAEKNKPPSSSPLNMGTRENKITATTPPAGANWGPPSQLEDAGTGPADVAINHVREEVRDTDDCTKEPENHQEEEEVR